MIKPFFLSNIVKEKMDCAYELMTLKVASYFSGLMKREKILRGGPEH